MHQGRWKLSVAAALAVGISFAALGGCEGPVGEACAGVDCSGHGRCVDADGTPTCACDAGYRADGVACVPVVPGRECDGVECDGHGECVVVRGEPDWPLCRCDEGYREVEATYCMPSAASGACADVDCGDHGRCVAGSTGPVCECDEGYRAEGTRCVEGAGARLADPAWDYALSPDGQRAVFFTGEDDGLVFAWDAADGEARELFAVRTAASNRQPRFQGFSGDSRYALFAAPSTPRPEPFVGDTTGVAWDFETGALVILPDRCLPVGAVEGRVVCVHNEVGGFIISTVDPATDEVTRVAQLPVQGLADHTRVFEHDGVAYVASESSRAPVELYVHRLDDGAEINRLSPMGPGGRSRLAFRGISSDGWLFFGVELQRAQLEGGAPSRVLDEGALAASLAIEGTRVAVAETSGPTTLMNADGSDAAVLPGVEGSYLHFQGPDSLVYWRDGDLMTASAPEWAPRVLSEDVRAQATVVRPDRVVLGHAYGSDPDSLMELAVIEGGVERVIARDVHFPLVALGPGTEHVDRAGAAVLVNVRYFDVLRGGAPGPDNGMYLHRF